MDPTTELPKLATALLGLACFSAVIAALLLFVDRAPKRGNEWRLLALLVAAGVVLAVGAGLVQPGLRTSLLYSAGTLAISAIALVGILLWMLDRRRSPAGRETWQYVAFVLPATLAVVVGLLYPAVRTVALSFFDKDGAAWVGLDNYTWIATSPDMLEVLRNTLLWVALAPVISTAIGLLYAILVDRRRGETVAKSLMFLPLAISGVAASIIWKLIYEYRPTDADQIGILNDVVVALGGQPQQWLLTPPANTLFLIVVLIWTQTGFATVVLSAAIKGVPIELMEAGRIDGAGSFRLFRSITVPVIRPALTVVVVTLVIATLKVFDIVRVMTGGQSGTSVIANEMYAQAFRFGESGRGSALAILLFVMVLPVVIYQVRPIRAAR